MKIFKNGCEIKLTYEDLYLAVHYWLHDCVFNTGKYNNKNTEGLIVKSLSLHPSNKYPAKVTIGYPETAGDELPK